MTRARSQITFGVVGGVGQVPLGMEVREKA
jgi:hypothetical protein